MKVWAPDDLRARLESRWLSGIAAVSLLVLGAGRALSAVDISLETGSGPVLQRVFVPLDLPANAPSANLRFELAFATDERLIPGEFIDSFTVTLRTTNRSHNITLLTVDRLGVTWVPGSSPTGLLDVERDLRFGPSDVIPSVTTNFGFTVCQSVFLQLPEPFLAQPSQLIVTLFDNDDSESSRAMLGNISVRPGNPSTIAMESSASPAGPYVREPGIRVDPIRGTITVAKAGVHRFYRLQGETPSRVTRIQRATSGLLLDYDKEIGQPNLSLTGSNNPEGPFAPVANAVFDLNARKIFVPLLNAPGFFRLTGTHPARIVGDVVSGNQRILEYEVFPIPPALESSNDPAGSYAAEMGVVADPFARRLRLPSGGVARFYRVAADVPLIIRRTAVVGDNVVLGYETP